MPSGQFVAWMSDLATVALGETSSYDCGASVPTSRSGTTGRLLLHTRVRDDSVRLRSLPKLDCVAISAGGLPEGLLEPQRMIGRLRYFKDEPNGQTERRLGVVPIVPYISDQSLLQHRVGGQQD